MNHLARRLYFLKIYLKFLKSLNRAPFNIFCVYVVSFTSLIFFMFLIFISISFASWKRFHRGSPSIFRNNNFKGSSFQWTLTPTTLNPFSNRSTLRRIISSHFFAMTDLSAKNVKWFAWLYLSLTYPCFFQSSKSLARS